MFHSRKLNNRINKLHERAIHIVYKNDSSSFELQKDGSITIHERNIRTMAIELYKVVNGLAPEILKDVFPLKECNRYCTRFPVKSRNLRVVNYGTETISFLGPKTCSIIPNDIKNARSLTIFKNKIKQWKPVECPCRICKTYIAGVGFINVAN